MAIARHRNGKGNDMVRVDNMQHALGDLVKLQPIRTGAIFIEERLLVRRHELIDQEVGLSRKRSHDGQ